MSLIIGLIHYKILVNNLINNLKLYDSYISKDLLRLYKSFNVLSLLY
jgi:hypothetical protein